MERDGGNETGSGGREKGGPHLSHPTCTPVISINTKTEKSYNYTRHALFRQHNIKYHEFMPAYTRDNFTMLSDNMVMHACLE